MSPGAILEGPAQAAPTRPSPQGEQSPVSSPPWVVIAGFPFTKSQQGSLVSSHLQSMGLAGRQRGMDPTAEEDSDCACKNQSWRGDWPEAVPFISPKPLRAGPFLSPLVIIITNHSMPLVTLQLLTNCHDTQSLLRR